MKILITGGAGFIGSALARRLSAWHDVIVFDDFSRGHVRRVPYKHPSADYSGSLLRESGDIRDPEHVARAMAACDVVFHLAYVQGTQTFYSDPRLVTEVALKGIMNVLDACDKQGGKELFLVSSSEVYQVPPADYFPTDESVPCVIPDVTNPRYSYGGGKLASEIAAMSYSDVLDRLIVIRPHNIYGPDMGNEHVIPEFAKRMKGLGGSQYFPIQGTGAETRCFCHINDCIDAFELLLERGRDRTVYHVGNDQEEITMADLALKVAEVYDIPNLIVRPGTLPQGSPPRRVPDIGRMEEIGYVPKIPLDEGLQGTLGWYRDHV